MKTLSVLLLSAFLYTSANAGNFIGNLGAALEGQQRAEQQQKLQQCVSSCRQGDGQCYQACAQAFSQPQQQQPAYTQKVPTVDGQCVQACTQAGYQYGLCQSKCTY